MSSAEKVAEAIRTMRENIAIIFHCDADGVCSAAQILRYFFSVCTAPKLVCGELEESTFSKASPCENAIILDLAVDHHVTWLKGFSRIVVIDHHLPQRDLNELGFVHFNPRLKNRSVYISASELCKEVCELLGVTNTEWIARIGAVGDRSIEGTEKEMKAVEYIDAVRAIKGEEKLVEVAKTLATCKNIDEFLSIRKYKELAEKLSKEVEKWVRRFSPCGEICFYEIDTPYSIISVVANKLFDMYPEKTIIVYGIRGNCVKISGRSRKYNLGEIFKEASEGIGKGGGHPVAAGARIELGKESIFIERLKKLLSGAEKCV